MAFDAHVNFALSTVATAPSPAASGTSLTLAAGGGALMPAPPFNATVWPTGASALKSNAEVVRVTAVSTNTLTITRAQEGSSARTIIVGDQVAATITAKTLQDAEGAVDDARLSANVALENVANVFTQDQLITKIRALLLVQGSGETTKGRVGTTDLDNLTLTRNLSFNGTNWAFDDVTKPGILLVLTTGQLLVYSAPAAATPAFTQTLYLDAAGNLTISGALAGGSVPDARLSANVALRNSNNNFSVSQIISTANPLLQFTDPPQPADQRTWIIGLYLTDFYIQPRNDAGVPVLNAVIVRRAGHVEFAFNVLLAYSAARLMIGGQAGTDPALRRGAPGSYPMLEVVAADNTTWAGVRAAQFISVAAGNTLVDLTVAAAANLNGGVNTTNVLASGNVQSTGYVYPGRVDVASAQGSYYLGSHSGGLYINTGLYLVGGVTCPQVNSSGKVDAATGYTERGRTTPMGEWTDVPADNSYFAVGGPGGGNWACGTVTSFAYTLIGKTMHLQIQCSYGVLYASNNSLNVLLPGGLTAARWAKGSAFIQNSAMPYETCLVYVAAGATWLYIHRDGLAAFPLGSGVSLFLELTVNVQ